MTLQARELPRNPTVIYDGDCSFCKVWVARLSRWDRDGVLQFLPLQSSLALDLSGRTTAELVHAIHLIHTDGAMFTGAAAVKNALLRTRWKTPVKILSSVPGAMFIAELVYERIAGSRYSLGCDGVNCKIDIEDRENV